MTLTSDTLTRVLQDCPQFKEVRRLDDFVGLTVNLRTLTADSFDAVATSVVSARLRVGEQLEWLELTFPKDLMVTCPLKTAFSWRGYRVLFIRKFAGENVWRLEVCGVRYGFIRYQQTLMCEFRPKVTRQVARAA